MFTEVVQTIICDIGAAITKSAKIFSKRNLRLKVEIDELQRIERCEIFSEIIQTLICDFDARSKVKIDRF